MGIVVAIFGVLSVISGFVMRASGYVFGGSIIVAIVTWMLDMGDKTAVVLEVTKTSAIVWIVALLVLLLNLVIVSIVAYFNTH